MGTILLYKDKLIIFGIGLVVAFIIGSGVKIYLLSNTVEKLSSKIETLNRDLTVANSNKITLEGALADQNQKLEKSRVEAEAKAKVYAEWVALPPEVKYKTVVKEVKSDECIDIKNALDELSTIKF